MKTLTIIIALLLIAGCSDGGQTRGEARQAFQDDPDKMRISYRATYKVIQVDENTRCVVTLDHQLTPTAIDCNWEVGNE